MASEFALSVAICSQSVTALVAPTPLLTYFTMAGKSSASSFAMVPPADSGLSPADSGLSPAGSGLEVATPASVGRAGSGPGGSSGDEGGRARGRGSPAARSTVRSSPSAWLEAGLQAAGRPLGAPTFVQICDIPAVANLMSGFEGNPFLPRLHTLHRGGRRAALDAFELTRLRRGHPRPPSPRGAAASSGSAERGTVDATSLDRVAGGGFADGTLSIDS